MNFKERILATMNHEEPDRVPVLGLLIDQTASNKILGKPPPDIANMLRNPELKNDIADIVNVTWNKILFGTFADALEAAIKLGFDANWTIYMSMQAVDILETKPGLACHEIWGRAWEISADEHDSIVMNYTHGLCTTEEEWEAWVSEKRPLFDQLIRNVADHHRRLADNYSDRVLPIGYTGMGIFENTWQSMGFVNFTRFVYQKPDFVRKVINLNTELYLRYLNAIMESGVEIVMAGDDLGHKTGPIMRPEQIENLFGESYRQVSELVHRRNKKLIWHSCGNVYAFLNKFVEWGFDGLITMEPTAGMELSKVREQVGHKLVLVGNLDVAHLLVRGTREEIEDAVRKAIRDAAKGGGYILSQNHSHSSVDPKRLEWMIEASHKYGKYPINI
jgi:uroporphyrinogen decarboxylase